MMPFSAWQAALILGLILLLFLDASMSAPRADVPARRAAAGLLKVVAFAVALALLSGAFLLDDPDWTDWAPLLSMFVGTAAGGFGAVALAERLTERRGLSFFPAQLVEFGAVLLGAGVGWTAGDLLAYAATGQTLLWDGDDLFGALFRDLWIWLVALVATVAASVRLFYNVRLYAAEQRQQAQELELLRLREQATRAQLQSIQARINPHFLYNALNSLAGLVHDRPERAERMTLDLARLFRSALDTDQTPFTTVRREVALLETYLAVEAARFGERLQTRIDVDPDAADVRLPRFLLQPLVENAVEHGVARRLEGGRVAVRVRRDGDALTLAVEDDGPAFPDDLLGGYGLQSVQQSLALLYPGRHRLTFENGARKQVHIVLEEAR